MDGKLVHTELTYKRYGHAASYVYGQVIGALRALKSGGYTRNAPCRCGSGKKFKKCCLPELESETMTGTRLNELLTKLKLKASN